MGVEMGADGVSQAQSTTTLSTPMDIDTEVQADESAHAQSKMQRHRHGGRKHGMGVAILPMLAIGTGIAGLVTRASRPLATSGPHVAQEMPDTALPEWFFWVTLVVSGISGGASFTSFGSIGRILVIGVAVINHLGAVWVEIEGCFEVLSLDILPQYGNPNPPPSSGDGISDSDLATIVGSMLLIQFAVKGIVGFVLMYQEMNGGDAKLWGMIPYPVLVDVFMGCDLLFVQMVWVRNTPAFYENWLYQYAIIAVFAKVLCVGLLISAAAHSASTQENSAESATNALQGALACFVVVCVVSVGVFILGLNPFSEYQSIFALVGWSELVEDGIFLMVINYAAGE